MKHPPGEVSCPDISQHCKKKENYAQASSPKITYITYIITVEPRYNVVLGTMKITLLYQVSHYIRVIKQRNIKCWDQQNYLVITGFCYIRPLYNEVPLYYELSPNNRNLGKIFCECSEYGVFYCSEYPSMGYFTISFQRNYI